MGLVSPTEENLEDDEGVNVTDMENFMKVNELTSANESIMASYHRESYDV